MVCHGGIRPGSIGVRGRSRLGSGLENLLRFCQYHTNLIITDGNIHTDHWRLKTYLHHPQWVQQERPQTTRVRQMSKLCGMSKEYRTTVRGLSEQLSAIYYLV